MRQKVARIGPWQIMRRPVHVITPPDGGGAGQMMDSGCNQIGFVQRSPDE